MTMMKDKRKIVVLAGASAPEKYVSLGYEVGKLLGEQDYVVLTGGGPGLMREANRGAYETGAESWGICLEYRFEELDKKFFTYYEVHDRFDERNDRLLSLGDAFIVLPGGLGTVVEALQITQREKFEEIVMDTPLLFIGDYHRRLHNQFVEMKNDGFITDDLDKLYRFVSGPQEMIDILKNYFETHSKTVVAVGEAHA